MIELKHRYGNWTKTSDKATLREALTEWVASKENLRGAYLAGANLAGANLAGADLVGADLVGADLAGAYLAGAYLAGANLAGANLAGAYLAGADLAGANLAGADLVGADLAGANLAGADLVGADLVGAYLVGAYLAGAYLAGAYLRGDSLIDAGQDARSYRFVGYFRDGVRVVAGCRDLTLTEARAHWANNPECAAKIALIEAVANQRGWLEVKEQAAIALQ